MTLRDLLENLSSSEAEELILLFKSIDKNGDGFIDIQELEFALQKKGYQNINLEKLKQYFLNADLNSDGLIDYNEFVKMTIAHRKRKLGQGAPNLVGILTKKEQSFFFYDL